MARTIRLVTRIGGQVNINLADGVDFQMLMKAVRSDGMLLAPGFMCPFDAIDSCTLLDVADSVPEGQNVIKLDVSRPATPFPPKPEGAA